MSQTKARLLYVGDPMCSWCYGIAPELNKTVAQLGDRIELELLMGGLRPYNTQTVGQMAGFLKEHWEHVQDKSGQVFNYEVLNDTTFVYDTEPPSRAVVAVRKLKPEAEYLFFKAVQSAFYEKGHNTNRIETYLPLANALGIETETFKAAYESEEMRTAVRNDFETAAEMGIRGFPTLVLQKGDRYYLIANGFARAEKIIADIEKILSED